MISFLVRCAITAILLFFLLREIHPERMLAAFASVTPAVLVCTVLLQVSGTAAAAFRWQLIMRRIGFPQQPVFFFKSYFKGSFFNQALPTSVGGDGIRILDLSREGASTLSAFNGVLIDRVAGLAGLLLLNLAGLLLQPGLLPQGLHRGLLFLAGGLLLLFTASFFLRYFPALTRHLPRMAGIFVTQYRSVYSGSRSIGIQLGLSVLVHLLTLLVFFILGKQLGLEYDFPVYLGLVPPVLLLTLLPLSLAGWGVREGGLVGIFLLIGADRSQVLALSLLFGVITLLASLPGMWVYLKQQHKL